MRIKTANKRRKRKLGSTGLRPREFAAFAFCNKNAPRFEMKVAGIWAPPFCKQVCSEAVRGWYNWSYKYDQFQRLPYYAGSLFYQLKNRLLPRYGKKRGLVLQHWSEEAWDERGGSFESKEHNHILEVFRLNGREFHQPTGHFWFSSDDGWADYNKRSVSFLEMQKQTTSIITGKKREQLTALSGEEKERVEKRFLKELQFLINRFRFLLKRELPEQKIRVEEWTDDYENRAYEAQTKSQNQTAAATATQQQLNFGEMPF
ncbi:MAG: hypothetical protein M3209_09555 [Acidobacteriota bacterium]|nr:hypothetical protein [Acidobacteriota bacterium]